jgi:uncharacterized membrane protein
MTEAVASNPKLAQNCLALYGVYGASMVLALLPVPLMIGLSTILMLGAIVMAYVWHGKAGEGVLETHFHWLIRTFWIGGAVYLPVLTILACITVISIVDMTELHEAIRTAALENAPGSPADDQSIVINTVLKTVWDQHGGMIMAITGAFTLPFVIWWFWRCIKGFRLLKAGKPVENVTRWL